MLMNFTKAICLLVVCVSLSGSAQAKPHLASASNVTSDATNSDDLAKQLPGSWYRKLDADDGTALEVRFTFTRQRSIKIEFIDTDKHGEKTRDVLKGVYQVEGNRVLVDYDSKGTEIFEVAIEDDIITIGASGETFAILRRTSFGVKKAHLVSGIWKINGTPKFPNANVALDLARDGSFALDIVQPSDDRSGDTHIIGQYHLEDRMLILESEDSIDKFPFKFDGDQLVLDMVEEEARFIFTRNGSGSKVVYLDSSA